MMKPINVTTCDFPTLMGKGCVYVDKTAQIYSLVHPSADNLYFLSRPRRFGKSLLISTFKALFQGRRELFRGLAIEKTDWDWEREVYPVLHLDMSKAALVQCRERNYAARFIGDPRPVHYVGSCKFSVERRRLRRTRFFGKMQCGYDVRCAHFATIAFCRVPNGAGCRGRRPYRANGHLARREWRTLAKTDCGEVSAANVVATSVFAKFAYAKHLRSTKNLQEPLCGRKLQPRRFRADDGRHQVRIGSEGKVKDLCGIIQKR